MKKLGSQLATGDVVISLPGSMHGPGLVARLLIVREDATSPAERTMSVIDMNNPRNDRDIRYFQHDKEYGVEDRGGVTADELHLLVKAAHQVLEMAGDHPSIIDHDTYTGLTALVERLAPVVPPTLAEVLSALNLASEWIGVDAAPSDVESVEAARVASDILDRARRAGML